MWNMTNSMQESNPPNKYESENTTPDHGGKKTE